jgi:hypothetical protein
MPGYGRQLGQVLHAVALATYSVSLFLPVVDLAPTAYRALTGWRVLRMSFAVAFDGDEPLHDWKRACMAGTAANVLFLTAFLIAAARPGRSCERGGAALCLLAAVLGRLVPGLVAPHNWAASNYLAGYWLWIISMLLAASGFSLLAMIRLGPGGSAEYNTHTMSTCSRESKPR